jgi:S1-C subfamily serine protease
MSKMLALMLVFVMAGCSGCAHAPRLWDPMGDDDAVQAQKLMRQTVQVDHIMTTLVPDPEKKELRAVKMGATGSGVVVAVKKDESLVLTAAHVCKSQETIKVHPAENVEIELPVLGESFMVWTIDLGRLPAIPQVIDEANDVCVLRVIGVAGEVARIGDHEPPIGARVIHLGSPRGILNLHRAFISEGRVMGIQRMSNDPEDTTYLQTLALPSDHGSSGGGVFYRGRVIGVISRVREEFKEISLATPLEPIKAAIKKAKENWVP